jgi:hypothetical protein
MHLVVFSELPTVGSRQVGERTNFHSGALRGTPTYTTSDFTVVVFVLSMERAYTATNPPILE